MAKLGELYKITSGGTPSRTHSEYYEDGTIPWVKTGDLKDKYLFETDEKISQLGLENSSARIYLKNTVLLAMYGATIGATSILKIDAATNQACAAFSPREDVLPEYLYAFLESQKDKFIKDAVGGAQPNLSAGYLKTIEFKLPSLEQQTRITRNLSKIDELLLLRKQQIAKLDGLIKARFVEMFGTFPANPFRWSIGKIQDVVSDVRYGSSRPAVEGGKYPYLRMNNITYSGELDLRDTKRIDIPDSELDKCTVRRGDVLFNRTNSKELVGKTCVYNRDELMVLAGFVIRVRINERIRPEVLSAFLNMDFSKRMLIGMCKTAIGQANINAKELQNIDLYIPPIELQDQFVTLKNKIDQQKQTVQQSLEKLELLKKALMQEYFG